MRNSQNSATTDLLGIINELSSGYCGVNRILIWLVSD